MTNTNSCLALRQRKKFRGNFQAFHFLTFIVSNSSRSNESFNSIFEARCLVSLELIALISIWSYCRVTNIERRIYSIFRINRWKERKKGRYGRFGGNDYDFKAINFPIFDNATYIYIYIYIRRSGCSIARFQEALEATGGLLEREKPGRRGSPPSQRGGTLCRVESEEGNTFERRISRPSGERHSWVRYHLIKTA